MDEPPHNHPRAHDAETIAAHLRATLAGEDPANLIALLLLSGVVFKLAKGQKDAGADHHVDTVEEPVEY